MATEASDVKQQPDSSESVGAAATRTTPLKISNRSETEAYLAELGIAQSTIEHDEVSTVEALMGQPAVRELPGATVKNLFLKDKKWRLFLLTARHDAVVRLQDLPRQLPPGTTAGNLRLASESVLLARLGVRQGFVTPLALANDPDCDVTFLCDAALLDPGATCQVNCHPVGSNGATTSLSVAGFETFLAATGHKPMPVQL